MSDHAFYANLLRFVAARTDRADPRTAAMMAALEAAAEEIAATGSFTVAPDRLDLTARAFAGVAAFLQKQILPEAVAHGHHDSERQIRWAVDTAMDAVNTLLARAALGQGEAVAVVLPAGPVLK
jgi:hypothetical protein